MAYGLSEPYGRERLVGKVNRRGQNASSGVRICSWQKEDTILQPASLLQVLAQCSSSKGNCSIFRVLENGEEVVVVRELLPCRAIVIMIPQSLTHSPVLYAKLAVLYVNLLHAGTDT